MRKSEIGYIVIVALISVSLLLGFLQEVFNIDLGTFAWTASIITSPVALAIGFVFAMTAGKAFPDFNKTM